MWLNHHDGRGSDVSILDEPVASGQRGRRRISTESEIESAALTALESRGFDELTMDQIAAAAGVSVRTAFRYFPAKVDTVLHTAREVAATLGQAMPGEGESPVSLHHTEDAIAAALTELVERQPGAIVLLRRVRTLMIRDARLRAEVAKAEGHLAGMSAATTGAASLEHGIFQGIIAATLSASFDSWASDERNTSDADANAGLRLVEHYERARAIRGQLLG